MRVLIDILHPAHVHFFRNFHAEMEGRGHQVCITARDKDRSRRAAAGVRPSLPADLARRRAAASASPSRWPSARRA